MRMQKFRIQNYKKIQDTDWIGCEDITVFVGKNESGKSSLFRGLSKINPSDGEKYDGLKEFPRRRLTSEFKQKDWPVSSVEFQLENSDVDKLTEICSVLNKVTSVVVTRHYSDSCTFQFKSETTIPCFLVSPYLDFLRHCKIKVDNATAPEGQGERLGNIKGSINAVLDSVIQQFETNNISSPVRILMVQQVSNALTSNLNEEWEQKLFQEMVDKHCEFHKIAQTVVEITEAEKWVSENMPRYIYFDRYDVIDSAIYIKAFIKQINEDSANVRLRTTKCLFQHAGLDVKKIYELDPVGENYTVELERMARERHILMNSASDTMTEKFKDWWEQRRHRFRYSVDGQFFRVWVSDNLDSSEIELDQRSAGMQYFFSFYLVFLEEASNAHKNSILLLDEPGLHYHGTAQKNMVKFLQKISQGNQLLYTTHSPFMIDGDKLQDIRVVYEDEKTGHTLVSTDVWPNDSESLFPLQAGLGYSLAQTLFYSQYNFVVEGITDYLILKAMSELLAKRKMATLNSDVVIVPSGGVRNMMPLASLLIGNKLRLVVLVDGDESGIQKERQLKKSLMVDCLLVSNFVEKNSAEIEDLFSEEFYMSALKEAYPDNEVQFNEREQSIACIAKRIKEAFTRLRFGDFNKWKVASVLVDRIQKDLAENKISDNTCMTFEKIFIQVNTLLKK